MIEQIKAAADRAAGGFGALSRLMENVGGPISTRRRLLMGVTRLFLLYGSEVWADADAQVQRQRALQVVSAYRTVSKPAVMMIAGVLSIALLAKERKAIYRCKGEDLKQAIARGEPQRTLTGW